MVYIDQPLQFVIYIVKTFFYLRDQKCQSVETRKLIHFGAHEAGTGIPHNVIVPVHPDNHHLLAVQWEGQVSCSKAEDDGMQQ